MKLIDINLASTPTEPKTLNYKVEVNLNGTWTLVHTGKFFVQTGQTYVQLDLQDVLINHKFVGKQSIKPVANTAYNAYMPEVASTGLLNECWYNDVRVTSIDSPVAFSAVTKAFFFVPEQAFGYEGITIPSIGNYIPAQHHSLLPTLPANKPDGFTFATLIYANTSNTITVKRNTSTDTTFSATAKRAYHIKLDYITGTMCTFYVNDVPVAKTESSCDAPYYLIWIQNDGALQCQPFLNTTKFSKTFTNKTAVDIHNAEWKISSTETGVWKMKSRNLNDTEYKDMGQLFESPYLLLLDMNTDRMHYVNVTSKNYEEKKRTRVDNKPFYFDLEVTSADHLRV
jgi:hypothetical protein